jgi:hypothetical protein
MSYLRRLRHKESTLDLYLGMCDIGHLPPNAEGSEALAGEIGAYTVVILKMLEIPALKGVDF